MSSDMFKADVGSGKSARALISATLVLLAAVWFSTPSMGQTTTPYAWGNNYYGQL